MVSAFSHDQDDPPVIWLLPPDALRPSHDPIHPIPIAISATLVTLVVLTLVILYTKIPKATTPPRENIELANLKDSIRVIRSEVHCTISHQITT